YTMSALPNINVIFNIDEEVQEIDMDLDENNVDNILDFILDATEGVGHM
ncbi:20201_t:CDS:1, partial [Gigaspora rosea]